MIADEYEIIKQLGSASFQETFKASKKGCQGYFIIDKLKKNKLNIPILDEIIKNAFQILKDINHVNVIKIIDFKEDSDYYYCIYEYYNGGSLYDYLNYLKENNKSFSEEEVQYIIKQLVEAIKYLHNKGIVHRVIKPDNIFINYDSEEELSKKNILKAKIKLGDFYVSEHLEKGKLLDIIVGTQGYMSPEIMENKKYNEKVDIWGLGATFCELLSCKTNFDPQNMKTFRQVPCFQNLSKEANSFIECTLQYEPEKRISAEELSKHEFLTKNVKDFSFRNK